MRQSTLVACILFALSASRMFAQNSVISDTNVDGQAKANDVSSPRSVLTAGNAAGSNGDPIYGVTHLVRCIQDLGEDDKGIFTSPLHVQKNDAYWLMPLGAATGLAFAYDTDAEQAVGVNANRTDTANMIADFGSFYATGAEGAGIYFLGLARKNPKLAETGRLGAEAVIDSGTVTLVRKLVTDPQRPLEGDGQGNFWAGGASHWEWDSSFPSDISCGCRARVSAVSCSKVAATNLPVVSGAWILPMRA
jgi:hypothetical protein